MSTKRKVNTRYCIVPECKNTGNNSPDKMFLSLPIDEPMRSNWLKAMRRDLKKSPLSLTGHFYVCEDHFDLDIDVINIGMIRFSLENGYRRPSFQYRLGLLPHRFDCQSSKRLLTAPPEKRRKSCAVEKLTMKRTVNDIMLESDELTRVETDETDNLMIVDDLSNLFIDKSMQTELRSVDKSVQARSSFKSEKTQANLRPKSSDASTSTTDLLENFTSDVVGHFSRSMNSSALSVHTSSSSSIHPSSYSSYAHHSSSSSSHNQWSSSSLNRVKDVAQKENSLTCTVYHLEKNPKLYLGINKDHFFIVNLLSNFTHILHRDIFLTLKKIRTNDVFERLADDFGISVSVASKVFNNTLTSITPLLSTLVYWPGKKLIQSKLPVPFRKNFSRTVCIIDCFEIQIEKPGKSPVKQAMTWSQYYNCNTFKYLLSCTPNGFINFISTGFTGRISDPDIVKESGLILFLNEGDHVMADRGFKNLSGLLNEKGVKLVRPPSVSKNNPLTEEDALSAKRIASLRVHVERVIGRIREFKMLKPHSTVDNNLIPYLDLIVNCVSGLVNLQSIIL